MTTTRIALLGTGLLGSGMARRFLASGSSVAVWNRTESKARALEPDGAVVAASPQDAVRNVDRVHLVLTDDTVVDNLLDTVAASLPPGAVVIDHSTTLPEKTSARIARMNARGGGFLHAPVFMSPQMAREGTGTMLVSGPAAVFEKVRPALESMTGHVWYLGERGDLAAAYKLFGNAMLFAITGGLADVITIARANGIDPAEAMTLFTKFQPGNAINARGPKMARGDFDASFTMTMARKDAGLMLAAARGASVPVLKAVASRMDELIASGAGELDLGALAKR